jgi:hypothetical protein
MILCVGDRCALCTQEVRPLSVWCEPPPDLEPHDSERLACPMATVIPPSSSAATFQRSGQDRL